MLWSLALPWLWHAEAAGIWAAQAAGRETLSDTTRRETNGRRLGKTLSHWANVYPDLMNTCQEEHAAGPPGVIRKPKLSELTRRPSGEWKRQTEGHRWPFKVERGESLAVGEERHNRWDTSTTGRDRDSAGEADRKRKKETSVTPWEAVSASGLRQHEDSRCPRGRKAMFHL